MERAKQRSLKSQANNGGSQKIQKQNTVSKLEFDSSSRSSSTFKENLGSCKQGTGMPIKNLLAEEMLKDNTIKKRSPSVIAKLMGLDGLPSPQPVHNQERKVLNGCPHRSSSTGVQKNVNLNTSHSDRKNSIEQPEFKDVYEDPEASHVANHSYLCRRSPNANLTKQQMSFIQKRCSEMIHHSEEYINNYERVDSNTDLMLRFLQQRDSLFVKHLDEERGAPASLLSSYVTIRSQDSVYHENNAKSWEGVSSRKHESYSHKRREDGMLSNSSSQAARSSRQLCKSRLERHDEVERPPTRIVVLKPNLEKKLNAIKSLYSPGDHRKHTEYARRMTREAGSWGDDGFYNETAFSRPKSKEAKVIAREITRRMRDDFRSVYIDVTNSRVKGYVGDESSVTMSESDSVSDSEIMLSSGNSFDWRDPCKLLSRDSSESSVCREAKKRLSERWKMTRGYKDVGSIGKGSTLGEMLAFPDKEIMSASLDAVVSLEGCSDKFARVSDRFTPFGISSRDGLQDTSLRNTSRSSSLPASSARQKKITSTHHEIRADDRLLMHEEAIDQSRGEVVTGNLTQGRDLLPKKLKRRKKRIVSSRSEYSCSNKSNYSLEESHSSQNSVVIKCENEYRGEQKTQKLHAPESVDIWTSDIDVVLEANSTISSQSSNGLVPELSTYELGTEGSCAVVPDDPNLQEQSVTPRRDSISLHFPEPEAESLICSKETDHLSPVSVLDVPSTENVSPGSDCFERVHADLHELRKQLRLLKMESEFNVEVPMLSSIDKEVVEQGSDITIGEKENVGSDNWKSSYLTDVLTESGLHDTDTDLFITKWYSPDCPLCPWLFDQLERKYPDKGNELKSERKLLFDRINSTLLELYHSSKNLHPYSKRRVSRLNCSNLKLEEQMSQMLAGQEMEANLDISGNVLDKEMHWMESRDNIDLIGKQIGDLMLNDLISLEVLNCVEFLK